MNEIKNNFCGYINVDNDLYVCNVNDHFVKLLPTNIEETSNGKNIYGIHNKELLEPEFLIGRDEVGYSIALLRNTKYVETLNNCLIFNSPAIIKGGGNTAHFEDGLTKEWRKFDAISFYGQNINNVYNPKLAALNERSTDEIIEQKTNYIVARLSRQNFRGKIMNHK
ncbi:MAG: hypothetical protein WC152_04100 [Candidatus Izemoplasmatales bacterium]